MTDAKRLWGPESILECCLCSGDADCSLWTEPCELHHCLWWILPAQWLSDWGVTGGHYSYQHHSCKGLRAILVKNIVKDNKKQKCDKSITEYLIHQDVVTWSWCIHVWRVKQSYCLRCQMFNWTLCHCNQTVSYLFHGADVNTIPLNDSQVRRQHLVSHRVQRTSKALLQNPDDLEDKQYFYKFESNMWVLVQFVIPCVGSRCGMQLLPHYEQSTRWSCQHHHLSNHGSIPSLELRHHLSPHL